MYGLFVHTYLPLEKRNLYIIDFEDNYVLSVLQLQSKELLGKDDQQSPAKENLKFSEECLQAISNNDVEDNVVPIVVRPGHIRFEPLEEGLDSISFWFLRLSWVILVIHNLELQHKA